MNIARLKHANLHWRRDGNPGDKAIVFANSLGTDLRLWDKVIPLLPAGLQLIRFDKRGHGLSSGPAAPYSMVDLTDDAETLLDAIGIQKCVFVGLSIGGMIAQSLAVRRPDLVSALVLSNTAARMGDPDMWQQRIGMIKSGQFDQMVEPILERWFSESFRQGDEVEAWRVMLARSDQEGYAGCCAAIAGADLTDQLPNISQPTLGICGSVDGASPPDLVRDTISQISAAKFSLIDGVGHLPCVEAPQAFAALLTEFLKEQDYV